MRFICLPSGLLRFCMFAFMQSHKPIPSTTVSARSFRAAVEPIEQKYQADLKARDEASRDLRPDQQTASDLAVHSPIQLETSAGHSE